jgi:hypothetical protein
LFQFQYPQEVTRERDVDQIFKGFKGLTGNQYLRVPQLWTLVLQSETIITCGPSPLPETIDGSIECVDEKSLMATERLIHVTDFLQRVAYLPLEQCRTYLQLRQAIAEQCLAGTDCKIDHCSLKAGNNEEDLTPSQWPDIVKAGRSVFVYVRVLRKTVGKEKKACPGAGLEHDGQESVTSQKQILMIDYGGLSSDESDNEDMELRRG